MRDLVYRRAVTHSAAADYDHCGHLVTWDDPTQLWISGDSGREWLRFTLDGPSTVSLLRITWERCPMALEVQQRVGEDRWITARTLRAEAGVQIVPLDALRTDALRLVFPTESGDPGGRAGAGAARVSLAHRPGPGGDGGRECPLRPL